MLLDFSGALFELVSLELSLAIKNCPALPGRERRRAEIFFLKSVSSQLSSAENNPHTKVTHLGEALNPLSLNGTVEVEGEKDEQIIFKTCFSQ